MALVISRNKGSETYLTLPDGTRITVTFLETNAYGQARLAFDAPPHVQIQRDDAIRKTTRSAA